MNTTQRPGAPKRRRSSINPAEVKQAVASNIITYATHPYTKAAVIIVCFFMCIVYYSQVEKWSVLDCVLFIVVTVSTVGYGTPHPTTDPSRMFTIFLMIFGVLAIFSNMITILNSGVTKLNKFFAKSVASRLKRTEKLFQRRLLFSVLWLALCAFLGAATFQGLEGWSYITALYFVIQTSTVCCELLSSTTPILHLIFVLLSADRRLRRPDRAARRDQGVPLLLHPRVHLATGTGDQ